MAKRDSHAEDNSPDPLDSDTTTRLSLSVGQWVLVRYDGLEFPGEVTACGETDAEVNVMHASGSAWKWPTNPDMIFYERVLIFCDELILPGQLAIVVNLYSIA